MKNKIIALLLCLLLLPVGAFGCGRREEDRSVKIVCTLFPLYEWTKNVVGELPGVEVSLLIDNGTDLHSYEPTTHDIVELLSADLVVYIGSASETWVEQTLARRDADSYTALDLRRSEGVTLHHISAESVVAEEAHDHEHGHTHDHGSEDEHLWLSLRNAAACTTAIADAIGGIDAERAEQYRANGAAYAVQLAELDARYAQAVAEAEAPTMLFADRFPFVYLAEDYGIRYVAAFEGCTTETDATPATILHLAEHADEWRLGCIFVTETSDRALAQSVQRAAKGGDRAIVCLDSMQAVTRKRMDSGVTYLGIMEQNLQVLQDAFARDAAYAER